MSDVNLVYFGSGRQMELDLISSAPQAARDLRSHPSPCLLAGEHAHGSRENAEAQPQQVAHGSARHRTCAARRHGEGLRRGRLKGRRTATPESKRRARRHRGSNGNDRPRKAFLIAIVALVVVAAWAVNHVVGGGPTLEPTTAPAAEVPLADTQASDPDSARARPETTSQPMTFRQ